jgi:hypothetical protein
VRHLEDLPQDLHRPGVDLHRLAVLAVCASTSPSIGAAVSTSTCQRSPAPEVGQVKSIGS